MHTLQRTRRLGASVDSSSWLDTFESNVRLIELAALEAFATTGKTTIVLQKL